MGDIVLQGGDTVVDTRSNYTKFGGPIQADSVKNIGSPEMWRSVDYLYFQWEVQVIYRSIHFR